MDLLLQLLQFIMIFLHIKVVFIDEHLLEQQL